jgi:hypothetical protein
MKGWDGMNTDADFERMWQRDLNEHPQGFDEVELIRRWERGVEKMREDELVEASDSESNED